MRLILETWRYIFLALFDEPVLPCKDSTSVLAHCVIFMAWWYTFTMVSRSAVNSNQQKYRHLICAIKLSVLYLASTIAVWWALNKTQFSFESFVTFKMLVRTLYEWDSAKWHRYIVDALGLDYLAININLIRNSIILAGVSNLSYIISFYAGVINYKQILNLNMDTAGSCNIIFIHALYITVEVRPTEQSISMIKCPCLLMLRLLNKIDDHHIKENQIYHMKSYITL